MKLNRRQCLAGGVAAALLPAAGRLPAAHAGDDAGAVDPSLALPHKAAFFPLDGTYLNAGSQHPLSRAAKAAVERYLRYKTMADDGDYSAYRVRSRAVESYAKLINATPEEIAFVPSTTAGENLVIHALGIGESGGRIVTDSLHFFGSFPTYGELAKRGMDVETLRHENGRIDLEKYEAAITGDTRLVAVSSVSTFNGFTHDLKALCELAHAKGALVYADVIHSVGAMPFDVRETGVDFCSASGYKWLMADMGLGFLYARRDRLGQLRRPWYGYRQVTKFESHVFPGDPPGEGVADYELGDDTAGGYFAMGTVANAVAAQLDASLEYLLAVGVERIQAYRQPLLDRLRQALPDLGYPVLTPPGTTSALITFRCDDAREVLKPKLDDAGIRISVSRDHFRVSPSVYNDMDDVERLIEVLA